MLFFSGVGWATEITEITFKRSIGDILFWALMGLWFGVVLVFHWRAFQHPLIFITVVAFASAVILGKIGNIKTSREVTPTQLTLS